MEVSGKKPADDSHVDSSCPLTCDPCGSTGENQKAENFCTECEEYLCDACTKVHRKLRFSRDHPLLGQDDMPKQKMTSKTEIHCKKHNGKLLDYFCKDHNRMCCTICVTLEHRYCNIEYIMDLMNRLETSGEYGSLREEMVNLDTQVRESIQEADKNSAVVNQNYDVIVDDVRNFRKEINAKLDLLEKEVLEEAHKIKTGDIQRMSSLKSELIDIQQKLHDATEKLDNYAKFKQNKQLVIASKQYQESMESVRLKFEEMTSRNKINELKFIRNDNLFKDLNSFREIGSIQKKKEDKIWTSQMDKLQERNGNEDSNRVHIPENSVSLEHINVRSIQDEKISKITGMKIVDSSRLALADYENCSIKIVNFRQRKSGITSYVKLESGPWNITLIDQNQLVATAPNIKSLIFLKIGETLTVGKTLNVREKCHGIDYTGNMLIVSFEPLPPFSVPMRSVQCLNMDGQVIKTIRSFSSISRFTSFPRYLVCSQDKQHIFFIDIDSVIKLDMIGTVIDRYSRDSLDGTEDITVDKYDNVYIAGRNSHNIYVLAVETRQIRPVLQFKKPIAIEICKGSDQMFVSKNRSDRVFVYKLT